MLNIPLRTLGKTELKVSAVGFGAGEIGDASIPEKDAEKILVNAFEKGINFFDTARSYGKSEERIGNYLSKYRDQIVISTKVGYDIEGVENWTYDAVVGGIDRALKLLKTDYIDIAHLHSCTADQFRANGVIDGLYKCIEDGKIKFAAYSGENNNLEAAVYSDAFQVVQTSVNVTDQKSLLYIIPKAKENNLGVIAKRPIANAVWTYKEKPVGTYVEEYWRRYELMNIRTEFDPLELFLRFTAFAYGIDTAIIGTTNIDHLNSNIELINKGPLPKDIYDYLNTAFKMKDLFWPGEV